MVEWLEGRVLLSIDSPGLPSWLPQGPGAISGGQAKVDGGTVSGAVEAIAVHPTDPKVVYAGTVGG
ncbi:MAG: hypothetical protein ACREJC_08475, partial [Tepidisphaeraceae bacterium]